MLLLKAFLCLILAMVVCAEGPNNQSVAEAVGKIRVAQNYAGSIKKGIEDIQASPSDSCKSSAANLGFSVDKIQKNLQEALMVLAEGLSYTGDFNLTLHQNSISIVPYGGGTPEVYLKIFGQDKEEQAWQPREPALPPLPTRYPAHQVVPNQHYYQELSQALQRAGY